MSDVAGLDAPLPEPASVSGPRKTTVLVVATTGRLQKVVFAILVVASTVSVGVAGYLTMRDLSGAEEETTRNIGRYERELKRVDAGVAFASRRRQLLLGMRDEIMRANKRIGPDDARRYAEYVMRASDKYPTFPPLLLLAVGVVESGFRSEAVSSADARGLYQIWPGTGRVLARELGWKYTKNLLFDPEKNTEMAALYLDILYTTYNDPSLILAEYNGGPRNASLFREGAREVAAETRNYVGKVMKVYERLRGEIEVDNNGPDGPVMSIYRSRSRRGKTLAKVTTEQESGRGD